MSWVLYRISEFGVRLRVELQKVFQVLFRDLLFQYCLNRPKHIFLVDSLGSPLFYRLCHLSSQQLVEHHPLLETALLGNLEIIVEGLGLFLEVRYNLGVWILFKKYISQMTPALSPWSRGSR